MRRERVMNKVTLWVRLNDLMRPVRLRDNFSGSLAPRPVHVFGRGRVRSQRSSANPSSRYASSSDALRRRAFAATHAATRRNVGIGRKLR